MGTWEHKNIILKRKKIIFIILVCGFLFFGLNVRMVRAEGNCNTFCDRKCPLPDEGHHFDDTTCRKVGARGEGYLCSCCTCEYIDKSKNEDVVCKCFCQGYSEDSGSSGNQVIDCHTGGLFQSWRTAVCACCGDCTLNDLLYIGVSVAELILKYLGVIALALFVLGGIIWITSGGSKARVKKGTAIIKGAIIGMIIVIVAFLLIKIIMEDVLKVQGGEYIPKSSSREYEDFA